MKNSNAASLNIEILAHQQTTTRLSQKFPSINFTSTSRALMSLSKRSRADQPIEFASIQGHKSKEMLASKEKQTGDTLRATNSTEVSNNNNKQKEAQIILSKVSKTLHFMKKYQKQREYVPASLTKYSSKFSSNRYKQAEQSIKQNRKSPLKPISTLTDGQVRFCDKKFGSVDEYAISSHVGTLCTSNNIRISVATNMGKSTMNSQARQVSFFGLFEGRNGSNKAEYMREHFHNQLLSDELFYYNFQRAVIRIFQKIDRQFSNDPKYQGDFSIASSIICVIIGHKMHIVRCGSPNATLSKNYGSYIKTFDADSLDNTNTNTKLKKSVSSLSHYPSTNNSSIGFASVKNNENVQVHTFDINKHIDFLILGNEGLYCVANQNNALASNMWKNVLQEHMSHDSYSAKPKPIHLNSNSKLSRACNRLCEQAVKNDVLGRCMSMIVIQFQGMTSCFDDKNDIEIPYMTPKEYNLINKTTQSEYLERQIIQKQASMSKINTLYAVNNEGFKFQINARYIRSLSNLQ